MIEIGTGGGSIARVDALRRLLAGPESAGAVPGPAAGALGGADPTVTDADDDSPALLVRVGCAGCRQCGSATEIVMNRDDAVYRGYRRGELERLYSHRHRIEGYDGYLERWPRESAAAREHLEMLPDVACGSRAAERYDVFPARPGAPVLVFFHGGYWHSQDKANFELMAPAYVARGTAFVSANYPLCPEVTLPELLDACRRCVVHVRDHAQSWAATRRACSCPATRRAVT